MYRVADLTAKTVKRSKKLQKKRNINREKKWRNEAPENRTHMNTSCTILCVFA